MSCRLLVTVTVTVLWLCGCARVPVCPCDCDCVTVTVLWRRLLIGACNPVACPIRVSWLGLWFTGPIQGVSWSSTFVPIKKKHKHVVRKRRWVRKRVRYTPSAEEQEAAAQAAAVQ